MIFSLVKFLYCFVLPPGIFILAGFILSIRLFKRQKSSAKLLAIATAFLYMLSIAPVSQLLSRSLEARYLPPDDISTADVIICLGGGAVAAVPDIDGTDQLSGNSANRLLTSVRLARLTGLPIIFSGGHVFSDSASEACIAQRQLLALGIPPENIFTEQRSRNTTENAIYTQQILTERNFHNPILVTSAFHMARSLRNFQRAGTTGIIPYPCDYLSSSRFTFNLNKFAPTCGNLYDSCITLHEYLGLAAISLGLIY